MESQKRLGVRSTAIEGLLVVDLTVHPDARGWFKENWQRAKMTALGVPDFVPVQNNVSFNDAVGVTRGMHAEPWDKFVSVATGSVFGAWVDLRPGVGFGRVVCEVVDPSVGVFVPRGVANGYQTLEPGTAYTYLVNAHWSPTARYTFVNLADPVLGIEWPISVDEAVISEKDAHHPFLDQVSPVASPVTVVLGAGGQLGVALGELLPGARLLRREDVDFADPGAFDLDDGRWADVGVVINAAAFTNVDGAQSPQGRQTAWEVNARGVERLARLCVARGITLVHVSTDYVFDGTKVDAAGVPAGYVEDDAVCPLSVYGASKAAGEVAVGMVPKHYLIRTSWVVGQGKNFMATMRDLARRGVEPRVVADQTGRVTYASDLAWAISHLVGVGAPFGTYHVTSPGEPTTWYQIARDVFECEGVDPNRVSPVTTEEYFAQVPGAAPRPKWSVLDTTKLAGVLGDYWPPDPQSVVGAREGKNN